MSPSDISPHCLRLHCPCCPPPFVAFSTLLDLATGPSFVFWVELVSPSSELWCSPPPFCSLTLASVDSGLYCRCWTLPSLDLAIIRPCHCWILLSLDLAIIGLHCHWTLLSLDLAVVRPCCHWISPSLDLTIIELLPLMNSIVQWNVQCTKQKYNQYTETVPGWLQQSHLRC